MDLEKKHDSCGSDESACTAHSERAPRVPRTSDEKHKIINRLRRVEGQVRGVEKMIEDDRYCVDLLIQLSAIQAALRKIGYSVLERHTKSCVAKAIEEGHGDEQINELLNVLKHFQ
ncbi:metal-sensing transcriptional repressor [Sporolactobacillus terrae]|uniref:Transcriptional regulator n=1 Tax=Sporolactobacillus terrae TaxID=269673 RepID=A0A5K7WXR7_9BACL|nr:metal-sensing transcriptional repressor [Sporolactobacillus terrae]BBN99491.1 transcriptional regulator [Sporolactobacillus terrae]